MTSPGTVATPYLSTFPAAAATPRSGEAGAIGAGLAWAITQLTGFLASPARDEYVDRVFGAERAAALDVFREMVTVLDRWRDGTYGVLVSGWADRFGRKASTDGRTHVITFPTTALKKSSVESLGQTLLHESAHGVGAHIIDDTYAWDSGFLTASGKQRLTNAAHFDFTVNGWVAGTPAAALPAGDPAGKGNQPAAGSALDSKFARTVSLVTHARVQAQNTLSDLVEWVRAAAAPTEARIFLTAELRAPDQPAGVHDPFTEADLRQADRFEQAISALSRSIRTLRHEADTGLIEGCAVDQRPVLVVTAWPRTTFAEVPIRNGNLSADPWMQRMLTAILAAYPPPADSGVTVEAIARIDGHYHGVRSQAEH